MSRATLMPGLVPVLPSSPPLRLTGPGSLPVPREPRVREPDDAVDTGDESVQCGTFLPGDGVVDAEFVALERVEDGGARASAVREETVGVARRVLTGDGGVVHEHRSRVEGCAVE